MKLHLHTFNLVLKHAFTISRRSFDSQRTLIVALEEDGFHGYGEATFNPYYPNTSIELMIEKLESLRGLIESKTLDDPSLFWESMKVHFNDYPFALCALDVAAHDLDARKKGKPLHALWGLQTQKMPMSSYTLSIDSIEVMIERMQQMDWPIYKIKLGTTNDLEIIRELRKHTSARFCVDANCAWTVDQCIEYAKVLKKLGVDFIEQPLAAADEEGALQVYQQSALPIIADESCRVESDVEKCAEYFHGINIKIMKCGGLTPARRMIAQAKSLGLKTMVGCMTESTVGISAIAQLLPLIDYADMDGALFLKEDIATGVRIDKGIVVFGAGNGTGVVMNGER